MTETPLAQEEYSLKDILNKMKLFVAYLIRKWVFVTITVIIGGGLGWGYYYTQTGKYNGTTTFVLQEKTSSLGGLSGIASQFGLDIGSMGGAGLFAGDNILEILHSRHIVEKVLLSGYGNDDTTQTLIDSYLNFQGFRKAWKNKQSSLSAVNYPIGITHEELTPIQDSIVEFVYKRLINKVISVDRVNKKSSVIQVNVVSKDKFFSKYMSERIVAESFIYYIETKTSVARKNVEKLEKRSDSILNLLNAKSYNAAELKVLDPNPAIKNLLIPNELASRDKTVLLTLYGEVVKNLELARMMLSQETPVIQVLDSPGKTLFDNKTRKLFCVFYGAFIAFSISCFFFAWSFFKPLIN